MEQNVEEMLQHTFRGCGWTTIQALDELCQDWNLKDKILLASKLQKNGDLSDEDRIPEFHESEDRPASGLYHQVILNS